MKRIWQSFEFVWIRLNGLEWKVLIISFGYCVKTKLCLRVGMDIGLMQKSAFCFVLIDDENQNLLYSRASHIYQVIAFMAICVQLFEFDGFETINLNELRDWLKRLMYADITNLSFLLSFLLSSFFLVAIVQKSSISWIIWMMIFCSMLSPCP